ncbi:class I SAM-dependent methyltransferase [Pararobbsia silviterrae]|uniref:Class I SAM-dependent methyltransferase n=1 Tax=Pararobbsia silviterrae TaxID=1792498 RepID=A0A494Y354_9BURK|nr:class I SAM-dependent methyltransferase [Pararobbsia silviterrae]RKP55883.1 class I SAM-dependent methyltransferase [Pararobbsia silviterrae]
MSNALGNESKGVDVNRQFYDALWSSASLTDPKRFNTWPLFEPLIAASTARLEVAPGLRPRLPIDGTHFVDLSESAVETLRAHGADAIAGRITALPFDDARFDLVCALDIIEHVSDDRRALAELMRVAAPDAVVLLSMPLHPSRWTAFDALVGHQRRYEPVELIELLESNGLNVVHSAVYGMQPESSWLLDAGVWGLRHRPRFANWLYNRVLMPLGLHFQKPLMPVEGLLDLRHVDEVLLICRRRPHGTFVHA